ncbi:hypothetical protein TNCV_4651201 [Trichonephila clavipes]|nr:hypothetical protein TNCV_4651201 [Trichonephila clavipes]
MTRQPLSDALTTWLPIGCEITQRCPQRFPKRISRKNTVKPRHKVALKAAFKTSAFDPRTSAELFRVLSPRIRQASHCVQQ